MLFTSLIFAATLLAARLIWQRRPNLPSCALFWALATIVIAIGWDWTASQGLLVAGVGCNATVTLANGGFMPVAAHRRVAGAARSLWVQRESGQHLLFLADNWGGRHVRFSVGDTMLLAGIALALAGA